MVAKAAPEREKAQRYLEQLDEARCAGRWNDVPELCRKVEKHAPHRKCLTTTARAEAQIAAVSSERPSTAGSTASHDLSQNIPTLLAAVDAESESSADVLQARVCLGWLHYKLNEPGLAIAHLPTDFGAAAASIAQAGTSAWSSVCLVKGAYLRGSAQEQTGAVAAALATYSSMVPWLSSRPPAPETPQFSTWTEKLLVRLCQLSDHTVGVDAHLSITEALAAFRCWARYCDIAAKNGGAPGTATAAHHRRWAWKAYYDTLSHILRHGLAYEPEPASAASEEPLPHPQVSVRLRQRAELKRVETIYEGLLITETQFPRASEINQETEAWVDSAVDNWRLLCAPTWTDADLGEGGKEGVARSLLDILYRAATKTFHSTRILRNLFIVHASLAEFEVAFRAYDAYVDIITRGKDRAEKSGEAVEGIDSDSTVLRTSAEAVRLLCRFGSRAEAEKALDIGHSIQRWMEQSEHIKSASDAGSVASADTIVEPAALAAAFCAIGISQAHWSRYTYEVEQRAVFQAKAIQHLRRALQPSLGDPNNLEALYALALVLAETRDVTGAIKVVKRALSPVPKSSTAGNADGVLSSGVVSEFGRERKLIPLWHLLALLLTSRGEFVAAAKACEAAFEQFGDPAALFGGEEDHAYRSDHLNRTTGEDGKKHGIADRMEGFEKSGILQVKMTQLALLELTDSSLSAVDGCDELLFLYSRLFGDPTGQQVALDASSTAMLPPKSAVGTVRGSIFRGRGSVKTSRKDSTARNSSVLSSKDFPASTSSGTAPAIQVTEEDGTMHGAGHHRHHLFHHHKQEKQDESQSRVSRSNSKKLQKRSSASLRRQSITEASQTSEVPPLPTHIANGAVGQENLSPVKSEDSREQPLRAIPHNMDHIPPPLGHDNHPPRQDVRLPAPFPSPDYVSPDPRFSKIQERRHKVSLLSDIWLFISGLYSRAQMFQDAREAIAEATKLVEAFEAEVSQESSTAKSLSEKGWGGGKSVEELWADTFSARGELLIAQTWHHQAREEFERALLHFPDHPAGIVGLSNILLDIYSEIIPPEPIIADGYATPSSSNSIPHPFKDTSNPESPHLTSRIPSAENQLSTPVLNRLAARDRAFGLLSTLTKLGSGWDYSEAWYALARAYEESGQIEKAKEVLWWCVELEDTHPVRNWKSVGMGGFVL